MSKCHFLTAFCQKYKYINMGIWISISEEPTILLENEDLKIQYLRYVKKSWPTIRNEELVREEVNNVWTEATILIVFFFMLCINWQTIIFAVFHFQKLIYAFNVPHSVVWKKYIFNKSFFFWKLFWGKKRQQKMNLN